MPILDCNVRSCTHNSDSKCILDSIIIDGSGADESDATQCASFAKRSESSQNSCGCSGGKTPSATSEVECRAKKCTFNDDCKCDAAHIGIAGSSAKYQEETLCASFFKE